MSVRLSVYSCTFPTPIPALICSLWLLSANWIGRRANRNIILQSKKKKNISKHTIRYHEAISYDLQKERNKLQIKWIWAFFVEVNLSELLLNDFLPISVSGGRRNVNNGIYRVASLLSFPTWRASKVNKKSVQELPLLCNDFKPYAYSFSLH